MGFLDAIFRRIEERLRHVLELLLGLPVPVEDHGAMRTPVVLEQLPFLLCHRITA
jgi:hypothetical protein